MSCDVLQRRKDNICTSPSMALTSTFRSYCSVFSREVSFAWTGIHIITNTASDICTLNREKDRIILSKVHIKQRSWIVVHLDSYEVINTHTQLRADESGHLQLHHGIFTPAFAVRHVHTLQHGRQVVFISTFPADIKCAMIKVTVSTWQWSTLFYNL